MKKTLLIAFTLFLFWNFVSIFVPDPPIDAVNLWNRNLITAERILFDVESLHDKTIVLGSSHAAGLVFSDNVVNLSLAGLSIYDGQMILEMRDDVPKAVWIEANVIQRAPSVDFARKFSVTHKLARFLPALRTRNQPVSVAYRGYDWVRPRLKAALMNRPMAVDRSSDSPIEPLPVERIEHRRWQTPVDQGGLDRAVIRLRKLIDRWQANDVPVAFFEMPRHPMICESVHAASIRRRIKSAFADVPYLDHPECADYQTIDGLHLTRASAKEYERYLRMNMNAIHEPDKSM